MTVWRYTAVPLHGSSNSVKTGDIAGGHPADVRAALRRIGLQVVELRRTKRVRGVVLPASGGGRQVVRGMLRNVRDVADRHFRGRRQAERADFYEGLATMLESGLPLLEAVDTLVGSASASGRFGARRRLRGMLIELRETLHGGSSLAEAMRAHASWFDQSEVAMVEAGQHSGTLPDVLRALAERHQRSGELSQKLVGALAYPAIVACVGLGVVVFLSTRTLPSLVKVLNDASIETPLLTRRVMAVGQLLAGHWLVIGVALLAVLSVVGLAPGIVAHRGLELPRWLRRLSPLVVRRMALARLSLQLSELLRSGVPVVEALRVLAPTSPAALRRHLLDAASRVEHGEDMSGALDDEHWFDPQFRRLLEIGQASGELDALLQRLGRSLERQTTRLIDRLAALLEPCVILALAALVGVVVMAAILPLLRLQEVI